MTASSRSLEISEYSSLENYKKLDNLKNMSKWTISISRQKLNILKEKKDRDKHRDKDGKKKKRRVEMFNTDDEECLFTSRAP